MSLAFLLLIGGFLLLGAAGVPIAHAMIAACIGYLLGTGQDAGLAAEQILNGLYNSFVLLSVPLFIFTANVMNAGAVSDRLLAFCLAVVGRFRGGLAHVNVMASLVFSGMSGSAIADAAGIGKLLVDMMRREGRYPAGFAAAITAASATIGPIVPPSIPMVLYALISGSSVGYLFLGGVVPGLLMAAALMVAVAVIARRRGFPREAAAPLSTLPRTTLRAGPALLLPVILLGGIYGGATTPTEAAAVAAAWALLIAGPLYRQLALRDLVATLVESCRSTGVVALIIGAAFVFNYVVATERIPQAIADLLHGTDVTPLAFLLGVNVLFLLLGCLFDATTLLLVMTPLMLPTCEALGIDLVHFGVVIVLNIMIGLITPPYGVLLFVIDGVTGVPIRDQIREIWPFLLVLVAVLLLLVLVPELVLWLPRRFGYQG